MRTMARAVIIVAIVSAASSQTAYAEQATRTAGEAFAIGINRLDYLRAEATRLRPELRKQMAALSVCTNDAVGWDAKVACVTRTQSTAAKYFEAELALLQDRVEGYERELRETNQMMTLARVRGEAERAAIQRRVADDLLPGLTKGYAELKARLDEARAAEVRDQNYIQTLTLSMEEYDAAFQALDSVKAKMLRLDYRQDQALHDLRQFSLFLEASLKYAAAHKETYEIERELTERVLFSKLSELRAKSIPDRASDRGTRAPDVESWVAEPTPAPQPKQAPQSPRFPTVAACKKANSRMSDSACLALVTGGRR